MAPVGIRYRSNTYQNIGCKFNKGCIIFLICKNNRLKLQYPCIRRSVLSTVNSSTGYTPFHLKTGRSPQVIPPLIPPLTTATTAEVDAQQIIAQLELDVKDAQDNLLAAKIHQAYHANEHRAPEVIYQEGDLVMLSTENRCCNYKRKDKKHVAKFMPQNDGVPIQSSKPSQTSPNTHYASPTILRPFQVSMPTS